MCQPKKTNVDDTTALYTLADLRTGLLRKHYSEQGSARASPVPVADVTNSVGSSGGSHITIGLEIEDCSVELPLEMSLGTVPRLIVALTSGCRSALAMRKDTANHRCAWSIRRWEVGVVPGRDILILSFFTSNSVEFTFQIDFSTLVDLETTMSNLVEIRRKVRE